MTPYTHFKKIKISNDVMNINFLWEIRKAIEMIALFNLPRLTSHINID